MSDSIFDVVICVGPNDNDVIYNMIPYTKKNIIGSRNIYLVCANSSIDIDGTITIDEKIFPFTKINIDNVNLNNLNIENKITESKIKIQHYDKIKEKIVYDSSLTSANQILKEIKNL